MEFNARLARKAMEMEFCVRCKRVEVPDSPGGRYCERCCGDWHPVLMKVHVTIDPPLDGCAGESMWVLTTKDAWADYEADREGAEHIGLLQNTTVCAAAGRREGTHGLIFFQALTMDSGVVIRMMGKRLPEIVRNIQ